MLGAAPGDMDRPRVSEDAAETVLGIVIGVMRGGVDEAGAAAAVAVAVAAGMGVMSACECNGSAEVDGNKMYLTRVKQSTSLSSTIGHSMNERKKKGVVATVPL